MFAGVASFISPCVLPLLPGYLSLMSGYSVAELSDGDVSLRRVAGKTGLFVAGFTAVFVRAGRRCHLRRQLPTAGTRVVSDCGRMGCRSLRLVHCLHGPVDSTVPHAIHERPQGRSQPRSTRRACISGDGSRVCVRLDTLSGPVPGGHPDARRQQRDGGGRDGDALFPTRSASGSRFSSRQSSLPRPSRASTASRGISHQSPSSRASFCRASGFS